MLKLKIKTDILIDLINTKAIEISDLDLEELKSKIKIIPEQKGKRLKFLMMLF